MAKAIGRVLGGNVFIFLFITIYNIKSTAASELYYEVSPAYLPHIVAIVEPVNLNSKSRVRREAATINDAKNQYQSITQSGTTITNAAEHSSASVASVSQQDIAGAAADTLAATLSDAHDGNATTATALATDTSVVVNYNVQNVGVNGTGQRKDYNNGSSNSSSAIETNVTLTTADTAKKTVLGKAPKKVFTQSAVTTTITATTEQSLFEQVDVSEEVAEKAVKQHNLTAKVDHHDYYNSTTIVNKEETKRIWSSIKNITANSMLSQSYRRAMTVELTFDFPFYGHYVRNITVATGGFLYTGEYVHSWLAATQYIAPLMANFDISLSNDSYVRMLDNGTAFTVVWENVLLQDKKEFGKFTFSATLHKNGDIVFTYFRVPIMINTIYDSQHPVKVGLSDAYIIDKSYYFARRKTIYEYHRVSFSQNNITNSTIIYLTALPTCLSYTDCESCINHNTTFECVWCPAMNRCSTGTDRKKQEWLQKGCNQAQINDDASCPALGQRGNNAANQSNLDNNNNGGGKFNTNINNNNNKNSDTTLTLAPGGVTTNAPPASSTSVHELPAGEEHRAALDAEHSSSDSKSVGVAFGFLVPICLVFAVTLWLFYAYRNPHTRSGQLLIQFRPSQWSWRRGEARYTAATIHM